MRSWPWAPLCACAVVCGCGSTASRGTLAAPQLISVPASVDCRERGRELTITVERFELRERSWRVTARIVNPLGVGVVVFRPHRHPPATLFGLALFETRSEAEVQRRADRLALRTQLIADRFEPPLGPELRPGESWRGSFSGPGRVPRGRFLRIVFGRFRTAGAPPPGFPQRFLCVSGPARTR